MGEQKKLTAEDILGAVDTQEEAVFVPQWGGTVTVKPFTKEVQLRMRKEAEVNGEIDTDRLEMLMFIEGVVDPKFTVEQLEQLNQKNAGAMDEVLKVIMARSGVTEAAAEQAVATFPAKRGQRKSQ